MRGWVGKASAARTLRKEPLRAKYVASPVGSGISHGDLANALWHRTREPAVPGSPIGQIRTDISRPSGFIPPADLINHRACGVISQYSAALWPTPECRSSHVGAKFVAHRVRGAVRHQATPRHFRGDD